MSELLKDSSLEKDEILITLWDNGYNNIDETTNAINKSDVNKIKKLFNIATKNDLTSKIYWIKKYKPFRYFRINLKSLSKYDTIYMTFVNSYLRKSHSLSTFIHLCIYFSTGKLFLTDFSKVLTMNFDGLYAQ